MSDEQWVQRGPQVPLPAPTRQLSHHFLERLRKHEANTALIDASTGETVSGAQLLARSVAVAMELRSRGVGPGDVVSVSLDNSLDVLYIWQGTLLSGAIYSPFNPNLQIGDVQHLLQLVQPKVVLCAQRVAAHAREAVPEAQVVEVCKENAEWQSFLSRPTSDTRDFVVHASDDLDQPLCILSSSGTSGKPKGVVLSHRNWHYFLCSVDFLRNQVVTKEAILKDVNGLATTASWLSGFLSIMVAVSQGTTIVVFPSFDVETLLAGVEKHKITSMYLAPSMVAAVAKHEAARQYDTSSLRLINFSGSNLSPVLQGLAMKKLGCRVVRYYGLTESLLLVVPGPMSAEKPGTVGKVAINVAMKIVDIDTGRAVGPNTEGEICFKSPMTFTGYFRNPEATDATIDKEGWVHTGDAGYYDEDGYFFIVDRYKELIKYKDILHVPPGDIEDVLTAHEGVKDAAVVGIEHDEDQEHPVGFVVRQRGHDVTAQELHQFLKQRLPAYKQLHGGIYFLDQIPRNVNEKIKRRELRVLARKLREENKLLH